MRWRYNTEMNPSFQDLWDEPRYKEIIAEIERDIAEQKEAFANSPLADKVGT
jgi:hypothetical protein